MMRSVASFRVPGIAFAVLTATSLTGCYRTYAPYGYGGYPAYQQSPYQQSPYQQAPIQTLTPGQSYIPNGSGGPVLPNTGTPTYQQPGTGSNLQPIEDNNAPNYPQGGNINTPDPYFGASSQTPSASQPNTTQTGSANYQRVQPAGALHEIPNVATPANPVNSTSQLNEVDPFGAQAQVPAQTPASTATTTPAATSENTAASDDDEFFKRPIAREPQKLPLELEEGRVQKVSTANAFGHDGEMKWLRGVVSQEPQDGSWSIVYDDAPDSDDPFGGHVSLAPSPELRNVVDGDIVSLSGEVDPVAKDPLGKPVYVISKLQRFSAVADSE